MLSFLPKIILIDGNKLFFFYFNIFKSVVSGLIGTCVYGAIQCSIGIITTRNVATVNLVEMVVKKIEFENTAL